MTVGDLIKDLQTYPRKAIVVMASDPEQNSISVIDKTYYGKIGKKIKIKSENKDFEFIDGEDFTGISMDEDKGKPYCLITPLY